MYQQLGILLYLKNLHHSSLGTFSFSSTPDTGTVPEFDKVPSGLSLFGIRGLLLGVGDRGGVGLGTEYLSFPPSKIAETLEKGTSRYIPVCKRNVTGGGGDRTGCHS